MLILNALWRKSKDYLCFFWRNIRITKSRDSSIKNPSKMPSKKVKPQSSQMRSERHGHMLTMSFTMARHRMLHVFCRIRKSRAIFRSMYSHKSERWLRCKSRPGHKLKRKCSAAATRVTAVWTPQLNLT